MRKDFQGLSQKPKNRLQAPLSSISGRVRFLDKWEVADDRPDFIIEYPSSQEKLFREKPDSCIFVQYHTRKGIHHHGNFAAMVAKKFFEDKGYRVLDACPGIARPAYRTEEAQTSRRIIKAIFPDDFDYVENFAKRVMGLRGGDPDLFVFREDLSEYFFVEAKGKKDKLSPNQIALFPLIEKRLCLVYLAQTVPVLTMNE